MCEQGRLRIPCRGQLLSGTVETKTAQISAKRRIHFTENGFRDRKCFGEIFSHSRLLRALAGKE